MTPETIRSLYAMANRLRRHSLESTTAAGSGHPSSCLSSAELVSTLFFRFLRFDIQNPEGHHNDRFILSKGHAAPVLWAALAEAGAFPTEKLLTLRKMDSDLEGHPTPRNRWVDVATGSLGQGLSIGTGMALSHKRDELTNRIFVLIGDGEAAEGSVWEAAAMASYYKLDNLVALLDVNRLGQSQATMYGHNVETYSQRFSAFGWHTQIVDGHSVEEINAALTSAISVKGQPSVLVARTLKGKGVSFMEDKDGWHGKPCAAGEQLKEALSEIGDQLELEEPLSVAKPSSSVPSAGAITGDPPAPPDYGADETIATRQAYGNALRKLGASNPRVVVLDGDTKNSTYSEKFLKDFPERFVECFIAEQAMVGAAVGMSAVGKVPFASTFACFLTRAYDQIRMAAISRSNIKICGSHAGVSIGEDGPSQMGLEDLAMMRAVAGSTVLYPSDGVSAERLVSLAAETPGIVYIRTTRPSTPILYSNEDEFIVGGSRVLRSSPGDQATIVAAGITLHESLTAYEELLDRGIPVRVIDLYSIKPVDGDTLKQAVQETGALVTVEDHYREGGLGDAVLDALAGEQSRFRKLAVNRLSRSGPSGELMEMQGISANAIRKAVEELLA